MAEPFVGEIRLFAGNFAPRGWAFCSGQLLPIAQNEVLFQLIGTTYGGDGQVTFALPDLRGRAPIHHGQGAGLSNRGLGDAGGAEEVTLLVAQMPAHEHPLHGVTGPATDRDPNGRLFAEAEDDTYRADGAPVATGAPSTPAGTTQPHPNRPPQLAVSFIIALEGIFPAQG